MLADFIQLAPGRTATVTWSILDTQAPAISVTGTSYTNTAPGTSGNGASTIIASVQRFNPDYTDELGWQPSPRRPT